jgi:hypothetical protein
MSKSGFGTLFLFFDFLRTYLIFLLRTELDVLFNYKMSILISMLINCLLLTKMVFSENAFLAGCNSSSIASWGRTGVVHHGQRDTKYQLICANLYYYTKSNNNKTYNSTTNSFD